MKKVCFFVALFTICVLARAQNQTNKTEFILSIAPSLGVLNGYAEEIVYYNKSSDAKVSQLLWNINPLIYAGFNINLDWFKPQNKWAWFADVSCKFGFPMKTGVMEDRDWLGTLDGISYRTNWLTHYSVHDNLTDNAVLVNADIGIAFKIVEKYLIRAEIAYDFMTFSWTAQGGSFLYPVNNHFYFTTGTDVITYKQTWHIISPGVSFYGRFNRFFDINLFLNLSPLIWCNSVDEHLLRNLTIKDTMDFGFFIKPRLVFSFIPKDFIAVSFSFVYTHISGTRGDGLYMEQGEVNKIHENGAGSSYNAFDVGLIVKFKILGKRLWNRTTTSL
jgi:outer membrane protease E